MTQNPQSNQPSETSRVLPATALEAFPQSSFLDVPALLADSEPRSRVGWGWYPVAAFLLVALLGGWAAQQYPEAQSAVRILSAMLMFGMILGLTLFTSSVVRSQRNEHLVVEKIEELMQLRRWSQAGLLLQGTLSAPMRTPQARVQLLIYLSSVLSRYHRFHDAIEVHEYLLKRFRLDDAAAYALRLGRAMAMLHENRLFDVNRAIADLRRTAGAEDSAGLALVEIYRDVMTGHPAEALAIFDAKLPLLRRQLGVRVADAYAFAAHAYDALDRRAEAAKAYGNATLLVPLVELQRRYPEMAALAARYAASPAPASARAA